MELDIGKKIQNARKESGMTQEQVAEYLGVSRQTISNWENEKSYPDIISVIHMSDLYHVSLDVLLKGDQTMSNYYDYLEESTNVVKSHSKRNKLLLIIAYLGIWAIAMIAFWFFTDGSDAMGYSLMYLWIILPVTTIVISYLIGRNDYFGKGQYLIPILMGIMYMLSEYGTLSMANMVEFHKVNSPEWSMIFIGVILSFAGIFIGKGISRIRKKNRVE